MKKTFLFAAFLGFSLSIFAQDNQKGIEYYKTNLMDFAKTFFSEQKNPNANIQAEKYYYLSLISASENSDSTSIFINQAIATDKKSPWGFIGEGRVQLIEKNDAAAEKLFRTAEKFGKKNPSVFVNIAEAYFVVNNFAKAEEYIAKAKKINLQYSPIYLAEGDYYMTTNDYGKAMSRYDNALYFNDKDNLALLKLALLYFEKMGQKERALEYVNQILANDPDYMPAIIVFADIKNSQAKQKEAIEAYERVISNGNVPVNVYERYAQALFFDGQYQKSLNEIQKVLATNPQNLVMQRLQAYNNHELNNSEALKQMEDFMTNTPINKIIYQDYLIMGKLYEKDGRSDGQPQDQKINQYIKAITNFNKALELRPESYDAQKEIANVYVINNEPQKAIPYFENIFEKNPAYLNMDMYMYSDACIAASSQYLFEFKNGKATMTPEEIVKNKDSFMKYVNKGIAANDSLINRAPNLYLGYLGKAKIYALIDSYDHIETEKAEGKAKPYYDQALEKIIAQNNPDYNMYAVECYRYLRNYYILIEKDSQKVIEADEKILEIIPDDPQALNDIKILKKMVVTTTKKANNKKP